MMFTITFGLSMDYEASCSPGFRRSGAATATRAPP